MILALCRLLSVLIVSGIMVVTSPALLAELLVDGMAVMAVTDCDYGIPEHERLEHRRGAADLVAHDDYCRCVLPRRLGLQLTAPGSSTIAQAWQTTHQQKATTLSPSLQGCRSATCARLGGRNDRRKSWFLPLLNARTIGSSPSCTSIWNVTTGPFTWITRARQVTLHALRCLSQIFHFFKNVAYTSFVIFQARFQCIASGIFQMGD